MVCENPIFETTQNVLAAQLPGAAGSQHADLPNGLAPVEARRLTSTGEIPAPFPNRQPYVMGNIMPVTPNQRTFGN